MIPHAWEGIVFVGITYLIYVVLNTFWGGLTDQPMLIVIAIAMAVTFYMIGLRDKLLGFLR